MHKLLLVAVFTIGAPCAAVAQRSTSEGEVRAFLAAYDRALGARDIAFLERALADDYVLTGESGRKSDRAQVLEYYARQRDTPSYRRISLTHENVVVRAVGTMAVVTNDYTSQTTPVDAPAAEPETVKGRHTAVFEKRNGRWMVIAEQDTEQPHDDKLIERQVARIGREYYELMERLGNGRRYADLETSGDLAAFSRLLTDEFTCACGNGGITRKAQELERYKSSRIKLDSVELLEQSVVAIDNNAAVESAKVRYVGTEAGQRIDIIKRYTTTWVNWGRGWQIIAQHTSVVED